MSEPGEETVVYDDQFVSWWVGLACTLAASGLSYFCTCKYSDFMMSLRETARDEERADPSSSGGGGTGTGTGDGADAGVKPPIERGNSSSSFASVMRSTQMGAVALRTSARGVFALLFASFVVLDFVALALLPLTLVVPVCMMIFVWGSLYRQSAHPQARMWASDLAWTVLILSLVAAGIATAPKGLYVVRIKKLVRWGPKGTVYTVAFLLLAAALHLLRRRPEKAQAFVGKRLGLGARNTTTIVRGLLTGMLGGQALVLLKLVAEIVEEAVFGDDVQARFSSASVALVVASSLLLNALHIYSMHYMLAVLDEENVQLLVPVHRFALILSASVGATVYLEEWAVPEGTPLRIAGYGISVTGMLLVCAAFARAAVRTSNTDAGSGAAGEDVFLDAVEEFDSDEDQAEERAHAHGHGHGHGHGDLEAGRAPSPVAALGARLWGLGGIDPEDDDEEEENFFMASARTLLYSLTHLRGNADHEPAHVHAEPGEGESAEDAAAALEQERQAAYERLQLLNYEYADVAYSIMVREGEMNPHTQCTTRGGWQDACAVAGEWKVRGPNYLKDRVKVSNAPSRMQLAAVQWSANPTPVERTAEDPRGFVQAEHAGRADRPFMLVISFMVPSQGNFVMHFVARQGAGRDDVFDDMLNAFVNAESDAYRNARFKIIPGVTEGAYVVRRAVGAKPAMLCKKLTATYHRSWDPADGDIDVRDACGQWFEASIDVGSSRIARSIMGSVKGFASSLVLKLGFAIESKTRAELPERLIGGVQLSRPNMKPRPGVEVVTTQPACKNRSIEKTRRAAESEDDDATHDHDSGVSVASQ